MASTKHTPGPWHVVNTYHATRPEFSPDQVRTADESVVAYLPAGGGLRAGRVAADAALIASAPELFAIAKRVLNTIDGQTEGDDCYDLIAPLRAAIAKAEA